MPATSQILISTFSVAAGNEKNVFPTASATIGE